MIIPLVEGATIWVGSTRPLSCLAGPHRLSLVCPDAFGFGTRQVQNPINPTPMGLVSVYDPVLQFWHLCLAAGRPPVAPVMGAQCHP